jgi:predicted acylesterase/phospholipase RssA
VRVTGGTRKGRTALVLGGGGITGGCFEIGALRALDAALPGHGVRDFDIVVGVSCGAVVGSHVAAGIGSDALFQSLGRRGNLVPPFERWRLLRPDWREALRRAGQAPRRLAEVLWLYARGRGDLSLPDALLGLGELIPPGVLDGAGLEGFIHDNLARTPCLDRFEGLARELYVVAVDVDTGERAVFGTQDRRGVAISRAVRASCSFPPAYAPCRIDGRDYVDGGVERNFFVDVAIAAGARLVVVVNPLLPLFNDPARSSVRLTTRRRGRMVDKGMPGVVDQTIKLILNSRTSDGLPELRRRHPDVDVVMLEPDRADYAMFFYNVARFSARVHVAQHGYATARAQLLSQATELRALFSTYGMDFSPESLSHDADVLRDAAFDLEGVLRTLGHVPAWRARERAARRRAAHPAAPR